MTFEAARGETNLNALLTGLKPLLYDETYVFVTMTEELPQHMNAIMTFREAEGLTVVAEKSEAERHGLRYTFPCRMIQLQVHSSLEAVGLFAAISNVLKDKNIPANAVSGYHHDYVFVPVGMEADAMEALVVMSLEAARD